MLRPFCSLIERCKSVRVAKPCKRLGSQKQDPDLPLTH